MKNNWAEYTCEECGKVVKTKDSTRGLMIIGTADNPMFEITTPRSYETHHLCSKSCVAKWAKGKASKK